LQKLSVYFFEDYNFKTQVTWFKKLLYVFLVIESSYFLCYFDLFFGENSIVSVSPQKIGFFKNLAFLLYNSESADLSRVCLISLLVLSCFNLFTKRFRFIPDLLLWFIVVNLNNRVYPALTGGDNLLNQFLFFNCFLSVNFQITPNWRGQLKICLHNLAVIAIIVQICLLYLLSALAKLNDQEWLSGKALITVTQIKHFSMFSFHSYNRSLDPLLIFLNYAVLFYQLLFPALIWIRKIKRPLLIFGILMHLYIAFVMGLLGFGFIMILGYVFFWPTKQAVR